MATRLIHLRRSRRTLTKAFESRGHAPHLWHGLVGWWAPALGMQGGVLYDLSGYGQHGTASGIDLSTAWGVRGPRGLALDFDGTDGFVNVPDAPFHRPTAAITVAAWVKAANTTQSGTSVVEKRFAAAVDPYDSYLIGVVGGGGTWEWTISIGGTPGTLSSTDTPMNTEETCLVGTYDGATQILYQNGLPVDSTSVSGVIGYSTLPLYIGLRTPEDLAPYFAGSVYEVRIYNRALSPNEVLALYVDPNRLIRRRLILPWVLPDTMVGSFPPDAIVASTNLSGVVAAVQDDPDSPDGTWLTASSATAATDLRTSFATPPANPFGSQTFKAYVRKTTGTPNPTLTAELRQNNTLRATVATDTPITSTTGQLLTLPWQSADLVSVVDGSDVELRLISTPGQGPGALPAYSSAGTLFTSATMPGTNNINVPAHSAGDLLILLVLCRNNNNDGTLSAINTANWTQGGGTGNMYGGTQNARIGFGWKLGNGSESVVNITTTGGTTTDRINARVYRFTATNGFDTTAVQDIGTATTGSGTTLSMPSVTPGNTNRLAVALLGAAVSTTMAAATGESGGNWTEPVAEDAQTNGTTGIQVSDQSGGGAISGGSLTITTEDWVGIGFSLVPASINVNTVEIGAVEWNYRHLALPPSAIKIGSLMMMGMGR